MGKRARIKPPPIVEVTREQANEYLKELDGLSKNAAEFFRLITTAYFWLLQVLEKKNMTIKRLRQIFNPKTESAQNILEPSEDENNDDSEGDKSPNGDENDEGNQPAKKTKRKGHGRRGVRKYTGAKKIPVPHEELKAGDCCPDCRDAKLYKIKEPKFVLRLKGSAPVTGEVYELEQLRCATCGKVFSAELPEEAGDKEYDESVGAIIALLKYGSGMPFYRLGKIQEAAKIPLPPATQWDCVTRVADCLQIIWFLMIIKAAQGDLIHNDDTKAKVLSIMQERKAQKAEEKKDKEKKGKGKGKKKKKSRTGTFTTGIISIFEGHTIALYLTGTNHAGENLDNLLSSRDKNRAPPLQMSDALSHNNPQCHSTISAHCLIHGRRNFVNVIVNFPEEVRHVIEVLSKVYKNDAETKKQKMSPDQRLAYHQEHSGPLMEELKTWLQEQLDQKKVEPNSSLGDAIQYMLDHWKKLTCFLEIAGAPLDNNIVERMLKMAILHRKNAYFFKTENGAMVGDMMMSIIQTCHLNDVNAFEYLVDIQKYADEVRKDPEAWLPWNYKRPESAPAN